MLRINDRVQVKSSYGFHDDPQGICAFSDGMIPMLDRWMTISDVFPDLYNNRNLYRFKEDPNEYTFCEDMFTPSSVREAIASHDSPDILREQIRRLTQELEEVKAENMRLQSELKPQYSSPNTHRKVVMLTQENNEN